MPYYLYKVFPGKRLELIESYPEYRVAREVARGLRTQLTVADNYSVRVVFAQQAAEAEHLVRSERPMQLTGED
jgi:hypothetical protein